MNRWIQVVALALAVCFAGRTDAFEFFEALTDEAAGGDPTRYGLAHLAVVYEHEIWPGESKWGFGDLNKQRDTFSEGHVRAYIRDRWPDGGPELLCLDVEQWPLYWTPDTADRRVPHALQQERIDRLLALLAVFKEELPTTRIGYYSLVPYEAWAWRPSGTPYNDWSWERVKSALRLIKAVDVFFPELYPRTRTAAGFRRFAHFNLDVAARVAGSRPILPFLKPFETADGKTVPLPDDEWAWQIDAIRSHRDADGLVIWGSHRLEGFSEPLGEAWLQRMGAAAQAARGNRQSEIAPQRPQQ
ncbi:hypothetical protein Pla108_36560 [Botrimarina colliarenosi]|uniref:Uncharacterized protein n=1 Tax=Botrimarina colliarenosi TaxID=2528001 RepID=A0A5C6A5V0_9BACT|nr:hypothetical protein [Botrimarina colliarenosi]TWT94806.1 hypothetical protein Pla108_36560 [Botrimarina colliarenosi]